MEQRKDRLIDELRNPNLSPKERSLLESAKAEVKKDIASVRIGGDERTFQSLWMKYK